MSHKLHIRVHFENNDSSNFRNSYFKNFSKKLVQTQRCRVRLTVKNISLLAFPGGEFGEPNINPVGITNYFGLGDTPLTIKDLKPNEFCEIYTDIFITYYSGHCIFQGNFKAADGQPIELFATTEILDCRRISPQGLFNFRVGTIIEDEGKLTEHETSVRNSAVALVALVVATASFLFDFFKSCN